VDTDPREALQPRLEWRAHSRARCRRLPVLLAAGSVLLAACGGGSDERRGAIEDLRADATPENVARIRGLLGDADRDVRAQALHALAGLGVPDAARLALASLDDEDPMVRAMAAKLLGEVGKPAHAAALAGVLLADDDPVARQRAAEALRSLGGAEALDALGRGLDDPLEHVRAACVDGLRELGPGSAIHGLERLLAEDPAWEVRVKAARALGATGEPAVAGALDAARSDPNEYVRAAVAEARRAYDEIARDRPEVSADAAP
jgi:HEAT repeat protein